VVDAGGVFYKAGFIECHQYDPILDVIGVCVSKSLSDTEDDGGPDGDSGLRMSASPL